MRLQFCPMHIPLTEVENRVQTWPNGKESIPEETLSIKEVSLLLLPQFFKEIKTWRKTYEYQNYLIPKVQHLWFVNTETNTTTHIAKVGEGEEYNDKRSDGSPKRKY